MSGYNDKFPEGLQQVVDFPSATLGFAGRNKESAITGITWPAAVMQLGADYGALLEVEQHMSESQHANPSWQSAREPGLLVFDIEPIFAPTRGTGPDYVDENVHYSEETYQALWSYLRLYDAAVGEFQPPDLAAIDYGNMLLRYKLSFAYKVVRICNMALSDSNRYQTARFLLNAMGFSGDAAQFDDLLVKLPSYIKKFNQFVAASSQLAKTVVNTFPGANRLPALMAHFFRDVEDETDYAQMYTMKPHKWWYVTYYVDGENRHCWNFMSKSMPQSIKEMFDWLLEDFIFLFKDESALQIQRYLNKIVDAGTKMPGGVDVTSVALGDIAFPNTVELGFDAFDSIYDRDFLIAINNATICSGFQVGPAIQNPGKAAWEQHITATQNQMGDVATRFNKPLNLPWRDATWGDFYNATQWHVTRHREAAWNDLTEIDPKVLGTDLIVKATMYTITDGNIMNPTYTTADIESVIYSDPMTAMISYSTLAKYSAFNYAPMIYVVAKRDPENYVAGQVEAIFGQLENLFITSYQCLASMKPEFVKNYWGFPFILTSGAGSFETHHHATGNSIAMSAAPSYSAMEESRDFDNPGITFERKSNAVSKNKQTARSNSWKSKSKSTGKDKGKDLQ